MNNTTEQSTHCQICARAIKANTGVIAHHGYERPFGWGQQTSSCQGARFAPYEQSRDRIPAVIEMYRNGIDFNEKRVQDLTVNPPETITRYARHSFDKNEELQRPEGFNAKINIAGDIPYFEITAYHREHRSQVLEARRSIEGLKAAIVQLQKRYDDWSVA